MSADIDAAIDLRTDPTALRTTVSVLRELGFTEAGTPNPDGIMHRYVKRTGGR